MKAASDQNAKNVIGELQLVYNKSRQAAITKELSEIVAARRRYNRHKYEGSMSNLNVWVVLGGCFSVMLLGGCSDHQQVSKIPKN